MFERLRELSGKAWHGTGAHHAKNAAATRTPPRRSSASQLADLLHVITDVEAVKILKGGGAARHLIYQGSRNLPRNDPRPFLGFAHEGRVFMAYVDDGRVIVRDDTGPVESDPEARGNPFLNPSKAERYGWVTTTVEAERLMSILEPPIKRLERRDPKRDSMGPLVSVFAGYNAIEEALKPLRAARSE